MTTLGEYTPRDTSPCYSPRTLALILAENTGDSGLLGVRLDGPEYEDPETGTKCSPGSGRDSKSPRLTSPVFSRDDVDVERWHVPEHWKPIEPEATKEAATTPHAARRKRVTIRKSELGDSCLMTRHSFTGTGSFDYLLNDDVWSKTPSDSTPSNSLSSDGAFAIPTSPIRVAGRKRSSPYGGNRKRSLSYTLLSPPSAENDNITAKDLDNVVEWLGDL